MDDVAGPRPSGQVRAFSTHRALPAQPAMAGLVKRRGHSSKCLNPQFAYSLKLASKAARLPLGGTFLTQCA